MGWLGFVTTIFFIPYPITTVWGGGGADYAQLITTRDLSILYIRPAGWGPALIEGHLTKKFLHLSRPKMGVGVNDPRQWPPCPLLIRLLFDACASF